MAEPPATPRWVKVFGIILLALTLLVSLILLTGRGRHGPERHMSPAGSSGSFVVAGTFGNSAGSALSGVVARIPAEVQAQS